MWGLPYCPSAPGICAIGFNYARYLAWISFLISVSSYEEKCEVPDDEEESAFLEKEELEPPPPKVNPLNLVLDDDILPEILKHLDADSLKSSRLVSRHWCQLATPILASRVAVHLYTVDKDWCECENDEHDHSPAFSFDLKKSRNVNDFQNFLAWRDSKEEASDRRLVSYQHFKVTFASWLIWPLTIVPQNMELFLMPRVQESLVSLTIQGRHLGWLRLALGNLPYLKSLKLEMDWFCNEQEATETDPDFDYEPNQLFNVEPGNFSDLPRLEELSVVQDKHFHDEPQWHWIFAASPRLSSINLRLAAEPDMFSSLQHLLRVYRGFGLRSLFCEFFEKQLLPASPDSPRLALVLHQILNSDRLSGGLRFFSCNVPLKPHEWAGVFRTTNTNCPLGSPLETLSLSLSIFTLDSRAEFVNDFLLFCPTFAGEAYFKRLKSLSLRIEDRLVRKNASSDEESGSSSSEPIQILKSSRILPYVETLYFYYFSDVSPCQQLSQQFFQPFPNLKSLTTNVDTRKCVTALFRHMPLGLKKLFLQSTNRMVQLKVEDFVVYLHKFESIEELILLRMEMSEVSTDESLPYPFTKFRNLKRLALRNSLSDYFWLLDASSRLWYRVTLKRLQH